MNWYWWLVIVWPIFGVAALGMNIRDNPRMRENIGWAEVWPVVLGPIWLFLKSLQWMTRKRDL